MLKLTRIILQFVTVIQKDTLITWIVRFTVMPYVAAEIDFRAVSYTYGSVLYSVVEPDKR